MAHRLRVLAIPGGATGPATAEVGVQGTGLCTGTQSSGPSQLSASLGFYLLWAV